MIKHTLNEREAAEYIGMSRAFLRQDRMDGFRDGRTPGPSYVRLGRTIRYLRDDLDLWLNRHRISKDKYYSQETLKA